jgi:23S rRNA (uracil1939-C5)-methyltransferase
MTPRKQITMQRRAKQDAKKHSAASKKSGKHSSGTNQDAEKLISKCEKRQGATSLPTEKLISKNEKRQGTTSVVPQQRPNKGRALAPEGSFSSTSFENRPIIKSQLVEIDKPIYGGAFLARIEGKAVFVPLTLPGEQALVRITQSKPGYSTAEAEQIVRAAPERIAPACPYFAACGGCHYQHTDYATQLAFKQAILRETLERAGVAAPSEISVLSGNPWAYRNRIRLAFDAMGNPGYRGRRSNTVIPIKECPIAAPLLVEAALAVGETLRQLSWALSPNEISFFCNSDETALLASAFTTHAEKGRFADWAHTLAERIPALQGVELIAQRPLGKQMQTVGTWGWGTGSLTYRAAGFDYRVDLGAFFQVNRWLVDDLVEQVTANHSGNLAWDLFAGVGLFARQLTSNFASVVAVESAPSASEALAHNLSGTSCIPISAETLTFLRRNRTGERPGLIIVDPPRTGLGAETCTLLGEIATPAFVYVSCDPATLARDLRALIGSGYQIQSITLADLFPQTFHLETVVQLRRA